MELYGNGGIELTEYSENWETSLFEYSDCFEYSEYYGLELYGNDGVNAAITI